MSGIAFFDIDGTLTRGVTSGAFIADHLGHGDIVREAEDAYARSEITNDRVCQVDSQGYRDHTVKEIFSLLDGMPLIDGIPDAIQLCKSTGYRPVLASCTWTLVAEYLANRFGFTAWCGPELEAVDGVFTGKVSSFADAKEKVTFAHRLCGQWDIDLESCIAIGDSRSDLILFEAVGASLAFNADQAAREKATFALDGGNIFDALHRFLRKIDWFGV